MNNKFYSCCKLKNIKRKLFRIILFAIVTTAAATTSPVFAADKSTVTHFITSHPSESSYCLPLQVKITAGNWGEIATEHKGTIVIESNNNKGIWSIVSGNGKLKPHKHNTGRAEYTFTKADQGVIILQLEYNSPPPKTRIDVHAKDKPYINNFFYRHFIDLTHISFILTAEEFNPNYHPFNVTQTAGIADDIYITAYGALDEKWYDSKHKKHKDHQSKSCGVVTSYHGNKKLKFWQDYVNPHSGTLTATIDKHSIINKKYKSDSQTVYFNQGKAKVAMRYRDAGKIKISVEEGKGHAKDDDNDDWKHQKHIKGSTADFVVKPAKFTIEVAGNPQAADENGPVFKVAGQDFSVTVTAQDNDGNTTLNYGNEVSPANVAIYASTLVAPQNGFNGSQNNGSIANSTNFDKIAPGKFQGNNFSYDEVGIIKVTAEVANKDYLGAGNVSGPESANVGRFVPAHFTAEANEPKLDTSCNPGRFNYLSQNFVYDIAPVITLSAKAATGTTTRNYTDKYFKLNKTSINTSYSSNAPTPLDSAAAEIDMQITDNHDGTATLLLGDGGGFKYNKINGTNTAPFNAEITVATTAKDSDNVQYKNDEFNIGSTLAGKGIAFSNGNVFYQGRMTLNNNYGSELAPLTIPMSIQYFNGSVYTTNTADNCTKFNNPSNLSIVGSPQAIKTTPTLSSIYQGKGKITLSAPKPKGQTGFFNIKADLGSENLEHLQHDWPFDGNADGKFDDNPQAQGTFGIYKGKDNIIHLREVTD